MAVFVRILLRYGAGALVTYGLMTSEAGDMIATDPDVAMAVEVFAGIAAGAVAEGWMWLAKRYGWKT